MQPRIGRQRQNDLAVWDVRIKPVLNVGPRSTARWVIFWYRITSGGHGISMDHDAKVVKSINVGFSRRVGTHQASHLSLGI